MRRKKNAYYRIHDKSEQRSFYLKACEWKKELSRIALEMSAEHGKLSDAPIKDFSTAVMYQEFLLTSVEFLNRANETLGEYVRARLERSGDTEVTLAISGKAVQSPGAAPNLIA